MAKTKAREPKKKPHAAAAGKPASTTEKTTKLAHVLAMLRKPGGATLEAITAATGWQAHSVRGFLSGTVKKKLGLAVKSERRDNGDRVYSLV